MTVSAIGLKEEPTVLFLSLVHPDFLPSVYALAQVLRDSGYRPTIVSFSSLGPGEFKPGSNIRMIDCGPHGGAIWARYVARRRFKALAQEVREREKPISIIAVCPFSYLEALRIARDIPVIYFEEEIYELNLHQLTRAPLSTFRAWRAQVRLGEASLIAAPSHERAKLIARSCKSDQLPATILNSPYLGTDSGEIDDVSMDQLLPGRFKNAVIVINTGRMSSTQGILELVESVEQWPDDARLAITGIGDAEYFRRVQNAVERSCRKNDICLLQLLPRAALIALQKRAKIGVCLLRRDSNVSAVMPAPNKVGEYLRWGLIVIASRLPFLEELPTRGVGVLVDDLEPSQIARAVCSAVAMASEADSRSRVQKVSREWLNMGVQARPILALLERTITSGGHAMADVTAT